MDETTDVPINSLRVMSEIIEFLSTNQGASLTDTARYLEKPTSTVSDYLRSLNNLGYLVHQEGEYYVSSQFLSIGTRTRKQNKLYSVARPEIDNLADELDESLALLIEENGYGVTLYGIDQNDSIAIESRPGSRNKLHLSAGGKAMLATMSDDEVKRIVDNLGLNALTDNTISTRDRLFEELEQIREQGYAVDQEEGIVGINGVAVPLVFEKTRGRAAILVYAPSSQLNGDRLHEDLPNQLQKVRNIIESNIRYSQLTDVV
jgi:IclR family acetate operon transcriptional repressor